MSNKPLLVLGAGGHAAVLVEILKQQNREITGLVSLDVDTRRAALQELRFFLDEDTIKIDPKSVNLINGIGSLPSNGVRKKIFEEYLSKGFSFESVIAESAIVSEHIELGRGVQIFPGAIVQAGVVIGENTIINSGAIVEHDCTIGSNNHIAPGVTLSGGVTTGKDVHIGTGANVIQSIAIEDNTIIGAGAVVTRNVSSNKIVYPAKSIVKKLLGN